MTENFHLRGAIADGRASLRTLNSLTKYPEIPTYHPLGEKGRLRNEPPLDFTGIADVTEKIDGTNARIITLPDGTVVVGSREELLWARGDLVRNAQLGIVDTLLALDLPERAVKLVGDRILVIFGEVYGHGVGPAGRRYAGKTTNTGFRVFDVAYAPIEYLAWSPEEAASWRQHGGQSWFSELGVESLAADLGARRVPALGSVSGDRLPRTLSGTLTWLEGQVARSRAPLFSDEGSAQVAAEGVVIRGFDAEGRRRLAKARFEDYRRTLRSEVS